MKILFSHSASSNLIATCFEFPQGHKVGNNTLQPSPRNRAQGHDFGNTQTDGLPQRGYLQ